MTWVHWYIHVCLCVFLVWLSSYVNSVLSLPCKSASLLKLCHWVSYYVVRKGNIIICCMQHVIFVVQWRVRKCVPTQHHSRFWFISHPVIANDVNLGSCRHNMMSVNAMQALVSYKKVSWTWHVCINFVSLRVHNF